MVSFRGRGQRGQTELLRIFIRYNEETTVHDHRLFDSYECLDALLTAILIGRDKSDQQIEWRYSCCVEYLKEKYNRNAGVFLCSLYKNISDKNKIFYSACLLTLTGNKPIMSSDN